ncbi:TetR/AcrR family transcriptional regulator [Corynebacterium glutamicum]|uniref:TetR/AcrR family transcriptional regulator n=1 Tax=Corynebacterium glutamicum TaxID=1718 RepID=UPI001E47662A|nr:TetR family transcriptional regulator [Corynebacterium glutamicum]
MAVVETRGWANVSMRTLAAELNIKAPSLYKHVKTREDIAAHIATKAFIVQLRMAWQSRSENPALEKVLQAAGSSGHGFPDCCFRNREIRTWYLSL